VSVRRTSRAHSAVRIEAYVSSYQSLHVHEFVSGYAVMSCVGVLTLYVRCVAAGFLVDYISHPVINSFTTAAAITIAASQLKASCITVILHALVVVVTV